MATYSGRWKNYLLTLVEQDDKWWTLGYDTCMRFGVEKAKNPGFEPKVGQGIMLREVGFSSIRGLRLEGKPVFDYSDEEIEAEQEKQLAEQEAKQKLEFERKKVELDAQYDALPEVFKRRIDKFRGNNPNFRWKYESYEMFCCTQAVTFANHFKTDDELVRWGKLGYEEQTKEYPVDSENSGNTFGASLQLARLYLSQPEGVVKMYGALAPLVGSREYGCVSEREYQASEMKKIKDQSHAHVDLH